MNTYPDGNHEFGQVNLATAVPVEVLQECFALLHIEIDAHLSEPDIELLNVDETIVVLINNLEYLSNATNGKSPSLAHHVLDLAEESCSVVTQSLRSLHWLSSCWVNCEEDLPYILNPNTFLG